MRALQSTYDTDVEHVAYEADGSAELQTVVPGSRAGRVRGQFTSSTSHTRTDISLCDDRDADVVSMARLRKCVCGERPSNQHDMRCRVGIKMINDPENPLNGQFDVYATSDISKGDVGPYSGLVLHDKEIIHMIPQPRMLARCLHFWYALCELDEDLSIFPSFQNPIALINDYCGPDRSAEHKEKTTPPNCRYIAVRVNGWPHIFVTATRDIKAGENLRSDYGDDFWKNHVALTRLVTYIL